MPTALQSQLDLLRGLYKWADFEDTAHRSPHRDRLAEPVRLEVELPDVLNGVPGKRQVTVRVKHVAVAKGVVAGGVDRMPGEGNTDLALADLQHGGAGLHGQVASIKLVDLDNSIDYLPLYGSISDLDDATGSLTIEEVDTNVFQTEVPRRRILDFFPEADLTRAQGTDPRVIKPFGVKRQVPLICLSADRKDWGAVVIPASGSLTWNTLYRNKSVVQLADYSIINLFNGLQIVRFVRSQPDDVEIRADLTSTEFSNQAAAAQWLFSDPIDGLGQGINTSSFAAAISALSALSYQVHHGIGPEPERAEDIINLLAVRGAVISKDSNHLYTWTIDEAGLHTTPQYLGHDYALGRGDGRWENVIRVASSRQKRIEDRVNDLTIQGCYTAGFGSEAFLMTARTRRTAAKGSEKILANTFIGDLVTLRKEAGYKMRRLAAEEYGVDVEVLPEARVVGLNQVVPLTVPYLRLGAGNPPFPLMCKRIEASRGAWQLSLVGYDSGQYTAEAETTWAAAAASVLTDFTFTFPAAPTDLDASGAVSVAIGDQGKSKTFQTVQAISPAQNVTHLVFQLVGPGQSLPGPEFERPCSPSQIVTAVVEAESGLLYTLQCFGRNKANDPAFQDGAITSVSYLAPGDPSTPAQVTGVSLIPTAYRTLRAVWSYAGIATLRNYEVQLALDAAFVTVTHLLSPVSTDVTISGLQNNTTYFVRVRAINRSGTPGAFSTTVSATTALVNTADINDNAISEVKIAANSISNAKIQANAISNAKVQANSIGELNVIANSISTIKIQDNSVTSPKRSNLSTVTVLFDFIGATHTHAGGGGGVSIGESVLEFVQVTLPHGLGRKPLGVSTSSTAIPAIVSSNSTQITINLYNPVRYNLPQLGNAIDFDFF